MKEKMMQEAQAVLNAEWSLCKREREPGPARRVYLCAGNHPYGTFQRRGRRTCKRKRGRTEVEVRSVHECV